MNAWVNDLYHRIAKEGMGRALRHRDFRIYEFTSWVSSTGMWMQRVGIGWLTWELTGSGLWLGLIAIAEAAPTLILVTVAGVVADRFDRLALSRIVQSVALALAAVLAALSFAGLLNEYVLAAIAVLLGIIAAFHMPVRMAMAPNLVPKEDLTAAISVHSALFNSTRFVGPALGGMVIASAGVSWVFAANAASFLVYLVGLAFIKLIRHEHSRKKGAGMIAEMAAGIKYAARHISIGPLLALGIITSMATRSVIDLFPGFADEIFHRGPEGLGMLFSAVGLGGVAGALWLANYGRTTGLMAILLTSLIATGVLLVVFATVPVFWFALICMTAIGFAMSVATNGLQILIQNSVDGAMRGRVMSLFGLSFRAGPATGALIMGAASTVVGLQIPVIAGAAVCLAAVAWMARRRHRIAAELEAAAAAE